MGKPLENFLPNELRIFLKWVFVFMFIFLVFPLTSLLIWQLLPKEKMEVIILDKTVVDKDFREHHAIHWTLNHLKYVNGNGISFDHKKDFFGFFPEGENSYKIHDFQNIDDQKTDELIAGSSLIYIADTYGVYKNDFTSVSTSELSAKIYGGMVQKDVDFLKKAYEAEKTIIAEFNTVASPTKKNIRNEFENLIGFRWTGWIARYFDELDTMINKEVPEWIIEAYKEQHDNQWALLGSGLVFLHEYGRIEIFENGRHTGVKVPNIQSSLQSQQKYGIPKTVKYPYWFDVILVSRDFEVISYYDIEPTAEGLEMLRDMGLPRYFPAAVVKANGKGKIYYFSGDFADNPIANSSYKYYGVAGLWRMFLQADDYSHRGSFFWNYYFPLMENILEVIEAED